MKKPYHTFLSIFIIVFCFSCKTNDQKQLSEPLSIDSFTTVKLEPVFEFEESDEVAFHIGSVKPDSHGNIIVHYYNKRSLTILGSNGDYIGRIGREGRGPAEFLYITDFMVDQDTLWVIDGQLNKIDRFEYLDDKYNYIKTSNLEHVRLSGTFLGRTQNGFLINNRVFISSDINESSKNRPVSLIDNDGKIVADSIIALPFQEQMSLKSGEQMQNRNKIFGNNSMLTFDGRNTFYALWTDSLNIDSYLLNGKKQRVFSHALQPVEVTDEERDSVYNITSLIPFRTDLRKKLPKVKPIVHSFFLDDAERVWVELLTKELGHGWFGFSLQGESFYRIDIPRKGAVLNGISGDRIYWHYGNELGQTIVGVSKINLAR